MQRPGCPAREQKDRDNSESCGEGMCAIEIGEGGAASRKPARRTPLQSAEDCESDLLQKREEKQKRSSSQLKCSGDEGACIHRQDTQVQQESFNKSITILSTGKATLEDRREE